MFNKDAIELLLNQGSVLHQLTQPKDGLPVLITRDGHGAVRAQMFEEVPSLEVTLDSVQDLGAWLKKHAHPDTTHILVDDEEIHALLDARHPRSHRAVGSLSAHPLWKRWADILGKPLTQKQLLAVLRSGADEIKEDIRAEKLRAAMGALTVRTGTTFKAEVDERGMTRLAAADATNVIDQPIPDAFEVITPLFVGVILVGDGDTLQEPNYRVGLEVSVEVREGRAYFTLSAPNLDVVKLRARQDVALCLRQQLDDRGWLVGLGALQVERQLQLGSDGPCALASDPKRRARTLHDHLLDRQPGGLFPHDSEPPPFEVRPSSSLDAGPLPTPTHDDGNCGPVEVGHDGPPPGETGTSDAADPS